MSQRVRRASERKRKAPFIVPTSTTTSPSRTRSWRVSTMQGLLDRRRFYRGPRACNMAALGMVTTRDFIGSVLLLSLAACGGGSSSGPTPVASPTPIPGATVVAVVFYDENGNGRADPDEQIRIPDVEVTVGGRSAKSEKATGRAVVTGVPSGAQTVSVKADSLPPFYVAEVAAPIQ